MRFVFLCLILLGLNTGLAHSTDTIKTAPVPDWVKTTEVPSPDKTNLKAPMRLLLSEAQTKFFDSHSETFLRNVIKIQTPQGLSAGDIAADWHPDTTDLVVHYVKIIRDGVEIDVLGQGQTFTILRREPNLEAAFLDGKLTGALQPAGLRVGDVIEYAFTHKQSNPLFAGSANIALPFLNSNETEYLKLRYVWPESRPMRWQVSDDLPEPRLKRIGEHRELTLEMSDVTPPQGQPAGAPSRYYLTGMLEISDYEDWSRISAVFGPLFEEAATLNPDSPLHREARRIAEAARTPEEQAELALRLVQNDIRYVFLGMDAGAYQPASADETWSRRYGDCKGKTAVLLALLQALGIKAEPALVSTMFDDGLGERLPVIGLFDHVLVRAEINDETYWLDGTRIGDRSITPLSRPLFKWALPLRREGAALTALAQKPFEEPQSSVSVDVDAMNGVQDAPFTAEWVIRGDYAIVIKQQLESLAEKDAKDFQKSMWGEAIKKAEFTKFHWRAQEEETRIILSTEGALNFKTHKAIRGEHYDIPGSSIGWDTAYMEGDDAEKPDERSVPYVLPFPFFSKAETTITLPSDGIGYAVTTPNVSYSSHGVELSRTLSIKDSVLTMTAKARTTRSEFTPEHAPAIKALMKTAFKESAQFKNSTKNLTASKELVESWSDKTPSTEQKYIDRGVDYLDLSQLDLAITDFNNAIHLNPDSQWGYANRGVALFLQGAFEKADKDFEKALSIDERNWVALHGLGALLFEKQNYDKALEKLEQAIAVNSGDTYAMTYRANTLYALGRFDEAIAQFREILKMEPNNTSARTYLIGMLTSLRKYHDAQKLVDESIKTHPDIAVFYGLRSTIYVQTGNIEKALSDLGKVLELVPDNPGILNDRCWLRGTHGIELDLAMEDCNQALELEPDRPAFLDSRAMVFLQKGDLSRAIEDYDAALSIAPDQAASLYGRGIAKIRAGDSSGEDDLRKAIEGAPEIEEEFREYGLEYEL